MADNTFGGGTRIKDEAKSFVLRSCDEASKKIARLENIKFIRPECFSGEFFRAVLCGEERQDLAIIRIIVVRENRILFTHVRSLNPVCRYDAEILGIVQIRTETRRAPQADSEYPDASGR